MQPTHTTKAKRKPIDRRLLIILLIVFVQIVGAAMVLPILPIYAKNRFGMSYETVTLLNSVFFAAQFIAGPFIGRLSDKYGRVPVLIISQVGTVIAFLMLGFAQSTGVLFAARILDGITGGNIIVAQAYVTDVTPRKERTQALGYIFLAFGVGFIIGPAIGGVMAGLFSYEAPYFLAAGAAAIVVLLTWRVLDESLTPEKRAENRSKPGAKMRPLEIIRNMPLVTILLVTFGAQFAFSMLQSTFSLYGEAVLFADNPENVETGVGLLLAVLGLGQIFTQTYLLKRVVKIYGEGMLIVFGAISRAMSMILLVVAATILATIPALFLFAIGTGMMMPALQSLVTNTVPDEQRGGVLGLYQSSISLSIICGSAISGSLFAISPGTPYFLGAVIFSIMVVPGYFLMRWARRNGISSAVDAPEGTEVAPAGD